MNWSARKTLIVVLVAGFLLRLGAALWWEHRFGARFAFGDSEGYWALAHTIAQGQPYQFGSPDARIFRTPGYPILLAPLFLLRDNPPIFWGRVLSALFGTAAIAAVWWLGRRMFGNRVALLAAAIAAVYPGAIALSSLVLSEAPFCPIVVVQLALLSIAAQTPSPRKAGRWSFAAGLAAGAATLVRPSWLLFTPFVAAVSVIYGNRTKQAAWNGILAVVGLSIVMTPWWVRNAVVCGHFVPTTLQTGASLYDAWNPTATGGSNMEFVPQFEGIERRTSSWPRCTDCFEVRLDHRLRKAAVDWAAANPRKVLKLAGVKFVRMWNIWPNEPAYSSWFARFVVVFTFVPILILGIMGACRTIHRAWPYTLCWLPALYLTLIHLVFVSSIRYREPAMLPLIVLAAAELAARFGKTFGRKAVSP